MIYNILQTPQQGMDWSFFVLMGGFFLVMYFFFMRPQMKKQKQEKQFQENLSKGQRVVTVSGLHGKINSVSDHTIVLETSAGKLTFERTAVSREYTQSRFPDNAEEKS